METKASGIDDDLAERDGDATNEETLDDLEDAFGSEDVPGDDNDVPSPDGSFDEDEELEQADPT